jgi:CheY-like chemotaxis protein
MKTWAQARRFVAALAGAFAGVPHEALRRVREGADATALELPQLGMARAASAGAEHFLPKPYSGNALLQVLHTALTPAESRPESP